LGDWILEEDEEEDDDDDDGEEEEEDRKSFSFVYSASTSPCLLRSVSRYPI
jgi:hypothetical protein